MVLICPPLDLRRCTRRIPRDVSVSRLMVTGGYPVVLQRAATVPVQLRVPIGGCVSSLRDLFSLAFDLNP